MIATVMVLIIVLLSVLQDKHRRMTALVYTLFVLLHEFFFQGLGGFYYFFTAALMGGMCIEIMAKLKYTTRLTDNLIKINQYGILLNTAAWILWEAEVNYETAYTSIATLLFLAVIISLLNWDGVEDGNYEINRWGNWFRLRNYSHGYSRVKL